MPIENISDTARWVAVYRAMETERPDAIFRDPFARRLAGAKGEEIVRALKRGRQMAWAMVVRTASFDEMILGRVRAGADLVVNLAAGLDTRPWRLDLPPSLRWVDVDLPGILGHKTTILQDERPRCRYEAVHADLTDAAVRASLLDRLGREGKNTLAVTEGLLIYLTADQVSALARDLHGQSSFRWWLFDLVNPILMDRMNRIWGKTLASGNAPFQFAPAEGTAFFQPLGWRELEFRSSFVEAQRLKREMPIMWFWRFILRFSPPARAEAMRRFAGAVLLEREDAGREGK
jgi:methyltransferase (TIGR00027 family)